MADFVMPALGADMTTGELVQWHVKPGDTVHRGDVVAVVETHKGAIDVEIFLEGVIDELAPLHVALPVGSRLATVRPLHEPAPPFSSEALAVRATPAARRQAQALHLRLQGLRGSGPGGAVTRADVERAAAPAASSGPAAAVPPGHRFDPAAMRTAIAGAMARSKREIPHYYLSEPVPLRRALDWLRTYNGNVPVTQRVLPAALFIKAVARALLAVPGLNGHHVNDEFRPAASAHVGVAIWLRGGGLVAPALHDVQDRPIGPLMAALADLVQRARTGGLRSSELSDPTVTVTALGEQGAQAVFGVIHPPQVALVGFGRVHERAWAETGRVEAVPAVQVSLSADHRVSDGHLGSAFLVELAAQLQRPEELAAGPGHPGAG